MFNSGKNQDMAGNFFWYDPVTTGTKTAAKFYGDVVCWTNQNMSQPTAR
jgi:predicted enzyme related to lactoylglutathione lyase